MLSINARIYYPNQDAFPFNSFAPKVLNVDSFQSPVEGVRKVYHRWWGWWSVYYPITNSGYSQRGFIAVIAAYSNICALHALNYRQEKNSYQLYPTGAD